MEDILFLIIGTLVALAASSFSFWEKRSENIINKKSNKYNIGLFIAIIIGIAFTCISGLNSLEEKKISDRKREISDSLSEAKSDQIIKIQEQNFNQTQILNESLLSAKGQIIDLQKKINNNIIGSSDPCYIFFQTASDNKGYTTFINESVLPILDLIIYITDFNELLKCKYSKYEDKVIFDEPCYKNCTKIFTPNVIRGGISKISDYYLPTDKNEGCLEIRFIYKTNIEYLEQLVYKKEGNNIKCKARLLKLEGDKYVFLKYINHNKLNWNVNFNNIFKLPLTSRQFAPIYWR